MEPSDILRDFRVASEERTTGVVGLLMVMVLPAYVVPAGSTMTFVASILVVPDALLLARNFRVRMVPAAEPPSFRTAVNRFVELAYVAFHPDPAE